MKRGNMEHECLLQEKPHGTSSRRGVRLSSRVVPLMFTPRVGLRHEYLLLLWLYSPCGPCSLFQFPNLYTVGLLGRVFGPSEGRYLHTEQHKHKINAHRHPCLQWDSNPLSQRSSERRQSMPVIDVTNISTPYKCIAI
jgi:hypothetical protein